MKHRFILLVLVFVASIFTVKSTEKNIGIIGGYNTFNKSAVIGVDFQYAFNSHIRISPDLQFMIRNNRTSGIQFNGDLHFLLFRPGTKVNVYPFTGLTYQSWRTSYDEGAETAKKFGLNVGAGAELYATSTYKVFVEAKCSLIKHFTNENIILGLVYRF